MHTFFLPAEKWREPYQVTGSEARHLVTVLRIREGERVRLLDGAGREGVFAVTAVAKNAVSLSPERIITHDKPAGRPTLAVGYGKSVRRGWLLEKAVELEAAALWFWQAERSQGKVPDEAKETWVAQLVAGAKQCKNPWLPDIDVLPHGVADLVAARKNFSQAYFLWEDESKDNLLTVQNLHDADNALFVIGPEGGFSEKEVRALLDGGFTPVSLGDRILRLETAAMVTLATTWWMRQQVS